MGENSRRFVTHGQDSRKAKQSKFLKSQTIKIPEEPNSQNSRKAKQLKFPKSQTVKIPENPNSRNSSQYLPLSANLEKATQKGFQASFFGSRKFRHFPTSRHGQRA